MTISVHYLRDLDAESERTLRDLLDAGVTLTCGEQIPDPARYHVLISGVPEREHLIVSPDLHTLIIPWAGLPQRTRELLLEFPNVRVYNLHHNARPTAEMAITLMLSAARNIIPLDRALRKHDWTPRYMPDRALLLHGRTAVILGYGAIGAIISSICLSFGMKVKAVRKHAKRSNSGDIEIFGLESLAELLPEADVLFITVPHTEETHGMIDSEKLGLLPWGAILVNVARGPVVDEESLYLALKSRRIRAGLDAWYNYPHEPDERSNTSPANFPFHQLDNVVMSPHVGGSTLETESLRMTELSKLLNAIVSGKPLPKEVDLRRGY
jgi:phosphoglycerate dehydrogenase-like enzyme